MLRIPVSNFNPRSHEGSDPVRHSQQTRQQNFNPRSHEGSDRCSSKRKKHTCKFQSSLPRGERQTWQKQRGGSRHISILAPTRGATYFCAIGIIWSKFQSSLPRGERLNIHYAVCINFAFQSSLPRGERQLYNISYQDHQLFQSSLPRGERQ